MYVRMTFFKVRQGDSKDWKGKDLKGLNDLLNVTRPDIIVTEKRKERKKEKKKSKNAFKICADIIETNTFNSQAVSLADYGMESLARELSTAGARMRAAADEHMAAQPGPGLFCRRGHRTDHQDIVHLDRRQQSGGARLHLR